jgi:hypothetical protein
MFPPVFLAQCANALSFMATGAMALAVARSMEGGPPRHRECWRLLGSAFLLFGIARAASDVLGGWALMEGPGSSPWNASLRTSPGVNYGSNLTLYALCTLLVASSLRRERAAPLPGRVVWGVLLLGLAAGMAAGWMEGPYRSAHLGSFVLLNTGLMMLLLSALAVTVVTGAADRLFALALAAYTAAYPLTTLWLSWQANDTPGRVTPRLLFAQLYFVSFVVVTLGITTYRWILARRGIPVPAVLPRPLAGPARADGRWR